MNCREVMQSPVSVLGPSDTVDRAARVMAEGNTGLVVICDVSGVAIGVLTDRDIVTRVVAKGLPLGTSVLEAMTREVVVCRPRDDFFQAQILMREAHVSRVICVDDDRRPVGIISVFDVAHNEDGFRLAKTVRAMRGAYGSHGSISPASVKR